MLERERERCWQGNGNHGTDSKVWQGGVHLREQGNELRRLGENVDIVVVDMFGDGGGRLVAIGTVVRSQTLRRGALLLSHGGGRGLSRW